MTFFVKVALFLYGTKITNMSEQGKEWVTPQLTVLMRHNADEAVLTGCKWIQVGGPTGQDIWCRRDGLCNTICDDYTRS